MLFCPVNSDRFVAKAHERGADAVILDLEDSIPISEKSLARQRVQDAAARLHAGGVDVLVRINRELDIAVPDLIDSVSPDVAAIVVPKVKGPEHVQLLAEVLTERERVLGLPLGYTRVMALVETAEGIENINAIARAHPRMVAMAVGGEDLATELDAEPGAGTLYVPKMLGVLAARAAGILPIGVLASVAELDPKNDAYRAMLRRSRRLGFAGATCVHPNQVALLNEVYSPGAEQVDLARRIVQAYEEAVSRGEGAVAIDGRMVDRPVVLRAQRLLAQVGARHHVIS